MRRYYRFMIYLMRAPGRYIHSLAWALQDSVGSNLVLVIKLIQQGRCHAYLLRVNGVTRSCEAHNLHVRNMVINYPFLLPLLLLHLLKTFSLFLGNEICLEMV